MFHNTSFEVITSWANFFKTITALLNNRCTKIVQILYEFFVVTARIVDADSEKF